MTVFFKEFLNVNVSVNVYEINIENKFSDWFFVLYIEGKLEDNFKLKTHII